MADRRSFWPTTVTGAGSAALASTAAAKPWADTPYVAADVKGSDVAPLALALSLVALAAWGALLVTRRATRRVVAGLGLAASLGALAAVLPSRGRALDEANLARFGTTAGDADITGWFYVAAVASAIAAVTFVVALLQVRSWPEMGTRYDAPGGQGPSGDSDQTDLWKALDEGHDPTT